MKYLLALLLPFVGFLVAVIPNLATLFYWHRRWRTADRHSPLTKNMLRPPGHSLRLNIARIDDQISLYQSLGMILPLYVIATHLSFSYIANQPESVTRTSMAFLLVVGTAAFTSRKMFALASERRIARLGLEGELSTGEELNQLMLDGCRVFHDIPTRWGNIDHVVVSHSGVRVVETKVISKPRTGDDKAQVTVDHERGVVHFPNHAYQIPVAQLETESKWLAEKLTESVGQTVSVERILALPGWFIKERKGKGSVYVINPCKPKKFFVHDRQVLSPELIQRISHQLEQICRDVAPGFRVNEDEEWEKT